MPFKRISLRVQTSRRNNQAGRVRSRLFEYAYIVPLHALVNERVVCVHMCTDQVSILEYTKYMLQSSIYFRNLGQLDNAQ